MTGTKPASQDTDSDDGEEQVIGDADRHQQVGVDTDVGELTERGGAGAGLSQGPVQERTVLEGRVGLRSFLDQVHGANRLG